MGKPGGTPITKIARRAPSRAFFVQGKVYKVRANHYPADVTVEMDHLKHLTGVVTPLNINFDREIKQPVALCGLWAPGFDQDEHNVCFNIHGCSLCRAALLQGKL